MVFPLVACSLNHDYSDGAKIPTSVANETAHLLIFQSRQFCTATNRWNDPSSHFRRFTPISTPN